MPTADESARARVPDARELLDALYVFVGVLTPDGTLVQANRAPLAAAGITLESVVGRPFWDTYWWSHDPALQARLREAIAAAARGERLRFDVEVRMAGGALMPIDFQIAPLRDAAGNITHLIPSAVEVTERRQTEHALREANALLETIFAGAPIGLGFWDSNFRFARVNERLAELNGIPPEAHLGRTPAELLPGIANVEALMDRWREMLRTGEPMLGVEIRGETPAAPGRERTWNEDFFPVRIGERTVGLAAVVIETTELRRRERELREADRRKDEFLAMLAHELRNPLGAIGGAIAVLHRMQTQDPQLHTLREVLDRQVKQLARLVDDLLDVARIAQDKVVLRIVRTDLRDAVLQAIEANGSAADARSHEIRTELPPAPVEIDADRVRVAQIVANLVHNAIKYTPDGGRIRVRVTTDAREAHLSVLDNGPGIDPELLPRVFELFTQGDRGIDRAEGGLGIGLTLVQRLVAMHGGRVEARSDGPGRGAEFRVHLPLAEPRASAADASSPAGAEVPENQGLRVLVVDDNPDVLTSMAMLLELEGHSVTTAPDADGALQAYADFAPDVVLLDVGLPGVDGYEVARRLRARHGALATLVAVTGYGQPEDRRRTREAGFDHHLVKPVDFDALQTLLASVPQRAPPPGLRVPE